ncbi:MAG: pyridoxamine 5'-phosphate oxidase family protein [Bryobacteraceae bacterium]
MDRSALLQFLRSQRFVVEASVTPSGQPQAAVVGVVVTDQLEVFFDTLGSARKAANLRANPRVAFVFGSTAPGASQTVQYEGIATEPSGPELDALLERYFGRFADGSDRRKLIDIAYFLVRPSWIRWSDYDADPPEVVEFTEFLSA